MGDFTRCVNGEPSGVRAGHDFDVPIDQPLLFCRRCGEVRRLEVTAPNHAYSRDFGTPPAHVARAIVGKGET